MSDSTAIIAGVLLAIGIVFGAAEAMFGAEGYSVAIAVPMILYAIHLIWTAVRNIIRDK